MRVWSGGDVREGRSGVSCLILVLATDNMSWLLARREFSILNCLV